MGVDPEPGSVELWVFGGTSTGGTSGSAVPSVSPDSLRARNTAPAGTVKKDGGSPATTAPARATASATASATPARDASTTPTGRTTIVNAPPAAASGPVSHGSATPAIIALVIVLVLAAVGITVAVRRPRRDQ
jgi:hypothetical protein